MPSLINDIQQEVQQPKVKQTIQGALSNPLISMRALVKNNLFYFMQYFWDTYSRDKFVPNWHIEKICKELEQVAHRVSRQEPKQYDLIINIPPGTTKTAMVSIMFPIWCWVNWYWMRFITTSHSNTLSLESAEYSRDIIRSDKFKVMFPDLEIKQDKDAKSNFRVIKKEVVHPGRVPRIHQGGGRVSTSVDARIIGFHAHIIIPDDLIDPRRALSEVGIKTANDYLDQTLSTRKTDKKVTVMVMIMQRLHQNDPTGHLLEKKNKRIRHICLPGEIRTYQNQVQPQEYIQYYQNELLDPVRLDWSALSDLEADLGQYGYSGQIGQYPVPPGGGMFKVDHFNIVESIPSEYQQEQWVRYWDKAGSQDAGAYTVGVKMLRLINNKIIIADVKRGQWSTENRERVIRQTAEADGKHVHIYIEQEPGSGGKESAENTIRNLIGFACYADRPTGDKVFRADPYSVQVNNGNVWLLRADWNHEYIEEHRYFPLGTYKDQVDASSGGFSKIIAKRTARMLT